VVARIAGALAPGGFLFLGLAETLRGLSDDFDLHHSHGTFYYQRRGDKPQTAAPGTDFVKAIAAAARRIHALRPRGAFSGAAKTMPPDLDPVIELFRCDRVPEALALLDQLPAEAGQQSQVLLLTAILLTHGGDLVQARRVCADLLLRDERNAGAHYLMALCRESAGDDAGAAKSDRMAAGLDPAFAMPHLHLGLLARRASDLETARRELSKAARLIPGEDSLRLLLFGGGFNREALSGLCQAQLSACGGES
jgi:chemotaxis protein methyltransferase CheR